eukprot:SAG22_NODE_731_length_7588_cov_6.237281_10_plen_91_part_00
MTVMTEESVGGLGAPTGLNGHLASDLTTKTLASLEGEDIPYYHRVSPLTGLEYMNMYRQRLGTRSFRPYPPNLKVGKKKCSTSSSATRQS